jgi:hypothetical protein
MDENELEPCKGGTEAFCFALAAKISGGQIIRPADREFSDTAVFVP